MNSSQDAQPTEGPAEKPLVFISHKHADAAIAKVLADWVRTVTGGHVDVFLSSDPGFDGPRVGKPLQGQLKDALWKAGVVILVYTSQDQDWSYCMWECGLAEGQGKDTTIVVIQCQPDRPQVFQNAVAVEAWEKDSLVGLGNEFLREDFFPEASSPVTGLSESELRDRAHELHDNLDAVLPKEAPENWSAWPFMRLEITAEVMDELHTSEPEERINAALSVIRSEAIVCDNSSGLPQIFGRVEVSQGTPFGDLVSEWEEASEGNEPAWLHNLAVQILDGSRKKAPSLDESSAFREIGGDREFVLAVGRIKKNAAAFRFDCTFVGLG